MLVLNLLSPFWGKQNFKYPKKIIRAFYFLQGWCPCVKIISCGFFWQFWTIEKELGYSELENGRKDVKTDAKALLADQEKVRRGAKNS